MRQLIGISLSFCVRAICLGLVELGEVKGIVAATRYGSGGLRLLAEHVPDSGWRNDWVRRSVYSYDDVCLTYEIEWAECAVEKVHAVLTALICNGLIYEPRLEEQLLDDQRPWYELVVAAAKRRKMYEEEMIRYPAGVHWIDAKTGMLVDATGQLAQEELDRYDTGAWQR